MSAIYPIGIIMLMTATIIFIDDDLGSEKPTEERVLGGRFANFI